jgi:chorismate-pyruvate lyase
MVRQELSSVFTDELATIAHAQKRRAVVREVYLYCDDHPIVFAHTVFRARGNPYRA